LKTSGPKFELKDKTLDYRFLYSVDVEDIPRQKKSDVATATGIKKSFFVQSCQAGVYKRKPNVAKSRKRTFPAHSIFSETVCVCEGCFINRSLNMCENRTQTKLARRNVL